MSSFSSSVTAVNELIKTRPDLAKVRCAPRLQCSAVQLQHSCHAARSLAAPPPPPALPPSPDIMYRFHRSVKNALIGFPMDDPTPSADRSNPC